MNSKLLSVFLRLRCSLTSPAIIYHVKIPPLITVFLAFVNMIGTLRSAVNRRFGIGDQRDRTN
jgi:hypothetical protein